VPVKVTLCEPAAPVMVSTAVSRPTTDGVNFTLFTHEPPPPAREAPAQLLVCEKSEAFSPEMATVETVFGREPRLLNITVSALEVVPGASLGNASGLGIRTPAAAGACARFSTVRTRVLSSTTRFPEVSAAAADGLSKTALNAGPPSPEIPQK